MNRFWWIVIALWVMPVHAQDRIRTLNFGDSAGTTASWQFTQARPASPSNGFVGRPSSTLLHLETPWADGAFRFADARSSGESIQQLGISYAGLDLDAFNGDGKTRLETGHPFSELDPFLFHGGTRSSFELDGLAIGYRLPRQSVLRLTRARIRSEGLEDRSALDLTLRSPVLNLSLYRVNRGETHVGDAVNLGTGFGKHRFSLQWMNSRTGVRYRGVRYQTDRGRFHYAVALENTRNPLYAKKNDNRIRFSLRFDFGGGNRMYAQEPGRNEGKSSNKTPYIIGAGAVAAAVALSSGSSDGDAAPRLEAQHAAAKSALNEINPTSVAQNLEYGGYVYRNADGTYSTTAPIRGTPTSVSLPFPGAITPAGTVTTASYHTHAAFDPRFDNENFSPTDILSDNLFGIDGYLGTPMGQFKWHDVDTGNIVTLGTIAN